MTLTDRDRERKRDGEKERQRERERKKEEVTRVRLYPVSPSRERDPPLAVSSPLTLSPSTRPRTPLRFTVAVRLSGILRNDRKIRSLRCRLTNFP